ncbi:MAG: Gx transporter family protein [Bacillota bacterium]|nr:Gx transporter family protein [Bacillota bacterium]
MRSPGEPARRPSLPRLALLLALGIVLHLVEGAFLGPLPVPGAKMGLANIVTLLTLLAYGLRWALLVGVLRVALASLLSGTFLSLGFMLAVSGAVVSALVMAGGRRLGGEHLSPVGTSVLGALSHNLAQLAAFALWARHTGVFYYLPPLLLLAGPTGLFTGLAAAYLWQRWTAISRL